MPPGEMGYGDLAGSQTTPPRVLVAPSRIEFWVSHEPTGQQRPDKHGSRHFHRTDTKSFAFRQAVTLAASSKFKAPIQRPEPVAVDLTCIFERPKAQHVAKNRSREVRPDCLSLRPGKPDADNVLKAVLDALNGVAYDDDAQVAEVHLSKLYLPCSNFTEPGVRVRLWGLW